MELMWRHSEMVSCWINVGMCMCVWWRNITAHTPPVWCTYNISIWMESFMIHSAVMTSQWRSHSVHYYFIIGNQFQCVHWENMTTTMWRIFIACALYTQTFPDFSTVIKNISLVRDARGGLNHIIKNNADTMYACFLQKTLFSIFPERNLI